MSDPAGGHLDEHGNPCTRHAPTTDLMLAWAAVGSRISGFHHDSASKLQSLMMALDEASELIGDNQGDVRSAIDTAMTALRDVHALLTENRALAKPPQRKQAQLAELLKRAAARHGVKLTGDVGLVTVHVAPPSTVHVLAMLLDLCAGPVQSTRAVDVSVAVDGPTATLTITGAPPDSHAAAKESITVSAFLLAREGGSLRCAPHGFVVKLPTTVG